MTEWYEKKEQYDRTYFSRLQYAIAEALEFCKTDDKKGLERILTGAVRTVLFPFAFTYHLNDAEKIIEPFVVDGKTRYRFNAYMRTGHKRGQRLKEKLRSLAVR